MCSNSLEHSWIQGFGNMFGIDEALKFKTLHGFGCPPQIWKIFIIKGIIMNLPCNGFPVVELKNLIIPGDINPIYMSLPF